MTDNWIIQDIDKHIAHRNRVVIIDPLAECAYLLPQIEKNTTLYSKQTQAIQKNGSKLKKNYC